MRSMGSVLAALALCAVLVADASAQRGPGPRGAERAELELRVRARFAQMMKARLGLSDEESARLEATAQSFMQQRQRILADEAALRRRMEAIALERDPTEDEATSLLARMRSLREEEMRLFQEEQEALLEVLTPVQLVRFHAMREQLAQRIQQLRGAQGPPAGAGGPGGPMGRRPPGGDPPEVWPER